MGRCGKFLVQHRRVSRLTSVPIIVLVCYSRPAWHGERVDESVSTSLGWPKVVGDANHGECGCVDVVASILSVYFMFFVVSFTVLMFAYLSVFCRFVVAPRRRIVSLVVMLIPLWILLTFFGSFLSFYHLLFSVGSCGGLLVVIRHNIRVRPGRFLIRLVSCAVSSAFFLMCCYFLFSSLDVASLVV